MSQKKKEKSSSWNNIKNTSTKTELETSPNTSVEELLRSAKESQASLVVVQGEGMGSVMRLKEGPNLLGRSPSCDYQLHQRAISSQHCEFKVTTEGVLLKDLGSLNGTLLNSKKIERPVLLQANDLIKIGTFVFKFIDNLLDAEFTENLHKQGTVDPLTGVANKEKLMRALRSSIDIASGGFPLSLLILDIDFFKKVNDNFGHMAGDYVLKELCRVVTESVIRSDDVLARFGGEEFVLVLPDSPLRVAASIAERLRKTIEDHEFIYDEKKIPVTASFGVAQWNPSLEKAEDFISIADEQLYKSKESGRNKVTVAGLVDQSARD